MKGGLIMIKYVKKMGFGISVLLSSLLLYSVFAAPVFAKSPVGLKGLETKPGQIKTAPAVKPGSAPGKKAKEVDLKITDFTVTPESQPVRQGDRLPYVIKIKNEGLKSSGRFMIKYYFAKNTRLISPGQCVATIVVPRLGKNASKDYDRSIQVPRDIDPGFHFLVARIEQPGASPVKDTAAKRFNIRSSSAPGMAPALSHSAPTNSDRPRIEQVSPSPVMTGRSVIIRGDRFGPNQGKVKLGFARPATFLELNITQWNNRRITAQVPEDADSLVPRGNSAVALIIEPHGFEDHGIRGVKSIRLVSGLVPRINTLSSRTIVPGQTITLSGENFLDGDPGEVRFLFHDHSYEGIVAGKDWTDSRIMVSLPEGITGITGTDGKVEVTNSRGRKAEHGIAFLPDLETKRMLEIVSHRLSSPVSLGTGGQKRNKIWIFKDITKRTANQLVNDWVVKSAELVKTEGNGSCTYIPAVGPGDRHLPIQVEIKVNEYHETVSCKCQIEIQGPAGTYPYEY